MSSRTRPIAGLAALALAVAACGGSASQAPASLGSGAPAASATPAVTGAAATATPASTIAPTASGGAPDIASGSAALANLDSYHMKITMAMKGLESSVYAAFGDGLTLDATIVTKPTKAADLAISMGTAGQKLEMGYRLIGDKAWISVASGTWMESTVDDAESTINSFAPDKMFGGFSSMTGMTAVGDEAKNGVAATHYTASGTDFASALNTQLGMTGGVWTVDYWVAKDGSYPVAYTIDGKGANGASFAMSLEVSGINSPSNVVEVPTVSN